MKWDYVLQKSTIGIPNILRLCTLYWHMKHDVEVDVDDSCHKNPGRSRKATVCDCWQIVPTLQSLRRSVNTFSFTDIHEIVDMNVTISKKTCPVTDVSCMSMAVGTINVQEKGSSYY